MPCGEFGTLMRVFGGVINKLSAEFGGVKEKGPFLIIFFLN